MGILRAIDAWLRIALGTGRIPINPMQISDREEFFEYLKEKAIRVNTRFLLLASNLTFSKLEYVYYSNGVELLIRYKPKYHIFGIASFCIFSGKIEESEIGFLLTGSYRFPLIIEFMKFGFLTFVAFVIVWTIGHQIITGSPHLMQNLLVVIIGAPIFFAAIVFFFGNVSLSIISRFTISKIRGLLDGYASR